MPNNRLLSVCIVSLSSLSACGGGGGSASPAEPINTAPVFDQQSYSFSVAEGSASMVGTVGASDAQGDSIAFSLDGDDADWLSIDEQGRVTFRSPTDYESPKDRDGDNTYQVTAIASDGLLSRSVAVTIEVENDPSDDELARRDVFNVSVIVGEVATPPYDRPSTWDDADNDCISDRHEILMAQHLDDGGAYPLVMSSDGCFVQSGRWLDPYDDIYYYSASDVQIDHVVALYESWISGLGNLATNLQRQYANTGSLMENVLPETSHQFLAVGASSNGEKGSRDPTEWMPRNTAYHCTYLKKWVLTKSENELLFDEDEFAFIQSREAACGVEPLPDLPPNP